MYPSVGSLIPDLQTADIVLPQQGQAAEVGVSTRALLAGADLRGLRRIMQKPERSHGIAAKAGEIVFRQVERERDAPHHPFAQVEHHVQIGLHHRTEVRQLSGPLIGAVVEQTGDDARVVRLVFRADIIALLEVGRRTCLERLTLQRLVTAIGIRMRLIERGFLLGRQCEKCGGFAKYARDQRIVHTMIFDIEKTLVEAGGTQARPDGAPGIGIAARQVRNVDDWKRRERYASGFKRGRHGRCSTWEERGRGHYAPMTAASKASFLISR